MPPRKREEELARPRERAGGNVAPVTHGSLRPVNFSDFQMNLAWHPTAQMIWESALTSGGSDFYQDSDMALLYFACGEVDKYLNNKPSSMYLEAINKLLTKLLLTETDRRAARIELQKPKAQEASYAAMAQEAYSEWFIR